MAKPASIELPSGEQMPILYEDRSVLAVDKPPGWMLVPSDWSQTIWNLQAWLEQAVALRAFWARARNIRFVRYVHRLDAETSGILMLARSQGALRALSRLFETREVEKTYWAVVRGVPRTDTWVCQEPIEVLEDGHARISSKKGKEAETHFRVLATHGPSTLVEARPVTGRTHQIRVHLVASGHPVLHDPWYGAKEDTQDSLSLALRAVALAYTDPFTRKRVAVRAPTAQFLARHGYESYARKQAGPGSGG